MTKVTLSIANVANTIAKALCDEYEELTDAAQQCGSVWFTGSKVWHHLYSNICPKINSDLDIFVCGDDDRVATIYLDNFLRMSGLGTLTPGIKVAPALPTMSAHGSKPYMTNNGVWIPGFDYFHPKYGEIDIFKRSGMYGRVHEALKAYPNNSHGHCKAAYSFTEGLVVLPNPMGW